MGGEAAFIDAEHALDPVYAKKLGVDIDNLIVSQPDTGEQALEITESVPQIMDGKVWEKFRFTIFQFRLVQFFHVVCCGDAFNGPIDIMSGEETSVAISEDETVITVQYQLIVRI